MSKSDQNKVKSQADAQITRNQAQNQSINEDVRPVLEEAKSTASGMLPGITSGYADIMTTGGYDPAITGRINDTFTNMAATGGISDADRAAMQAQASNAARSTYQTAGDTAQRRAAATGSFGDTSAAVLGHLAREGSQAAERAVTDTNANLAKITQEGKLAGAQGLTGVQQGIAGNKLAAAGGMTNLYGMNLSEVNATVDAIIRSYQTTGQLSNQDLSILTNLANQPGVFDKIIQTIGTVGGAGAGIIKAAYPRGIAGGNPK